jgi:hypothetical protein
VEPITFVAVVVREVSIMELAVPLVLVRVSVADVAIREAVQVCATLVALTVKEVVVTLVLFVVRVVNAAEKVSVVKAVGDWVVRVSARASVTVLSLVVDVSVSDDVSGTLNVVVKFMLEACVDIHVIVEEAEVWVWLLFVTLVLVNIIVEETGMKVSVSVVRVLLDARVVSDCAPVVSSMLLVRVLVDVTVLDV